MVGKTSEQQNLFLQKQTKPKTVIFWSGILTDKTHFEKVFEFSICWWLLGTSIYNHLGWYFKFCPPQDKGFLISRKKSIFNFLFLLLVRSWCSKWQPQWVPTDGHQIGNCWWYHELDSNINNLLYYQLYAQESFV